MSISTLINDTYKPWLSGRMNNLNMDGSLNVVGNLSLTNGGNLNVVGNGVIYAQTIGNIGNVDPLLNTLVVSANTVVFQESISTATTLANQATSPTTEVPINANIAMAAPSFIITTQPSNLASLDNYVFRIRNSYLSTTCLIFATVINISTDTTVSVFLKNRTADDVDCVITNTSSVAWGGTTVTINFLIVDPIV